MSEVRIHIPHGIIHMGDGPITTITRYVPYVFHFVPNDYSALPACRALDTPRKPRKTFRRLTDSERAERNAQIVALRNEGHTLQTIGTRFDLSRERVSQIVKRAERIARKNAK